jgi:hypothetical protein
MDKEGLTGLPRLQINLLLDFYGQLLTEKTRTMLEESFAEDLSLAEIADRHSISRQAVHDRIHQGLHSLEEYEARLGLLDRFRKQKACLEGAIRDLDDGQMEAARAKLDQLNQLI